MTATGTSLGPIVLPLPQPATQSATVADPALDVVVAFIAAMMTAYAGSAWKAVATGEPIVRKTFTHDPQDYEFSEGDLPALYIFRTGSSKNIDDIAEDFRVHYDNVRLFWVLPPQAQDVQRRRIPIIHAIAKLNDASIDRGRDPNYVRADDPDPTKTAQGTVLIRAAGLKWLCVRQWAKTQLAIQMLPTAGQRQVYQALDMKFEFEEQIVQGYADISAIPNLDLMVAVSQNDGAPNLPFSEHLNVGAFSSGFSTGFDT